MYPSEASFLGLTAEEISIIEGVRDIIGDRPSPILEESDNPGHAKAISSDGSMYELQQPKGWPVVIMVDGTEYSSTSDPQVVGYKYLVFSGVSLDNTITYSFLYNNFRFSDQEIISAYDNSAASALTEQCNLTPEQLTVPLIILATAVVLLQGEFQALAAEAVTIEDNDSKYDNSIRLVALQREIKDLRDRLNSALREKTKCATINLPIFRVE